LINQSGRGDKDIFTIAAALGDASWRAFLRDTVATWERQGL
jgi:tryptophan synthase beta chain